MTPANWIAVILGVTGLAAIAYNYRRGAISQVGAVLGLVLGYLVARLMGGEFANAMSVPPLMGYFMIFALVYIVVALVAKALKITLKVACLGILDRLCGAVMGLLKWSVLSSLLLNLLLFCGLPEEYFNSPFTQWTCDFASKIFGTIAAFQ